MWLYRFMQVLVHVFLVPVFLITRKGKENVPKTGRMLFVGNHINLLDPVIMSFITPRQLHFMAKSELFSDKHPILRWLIKNVGGFAINRGEPDLKGIRHALSLLNEERAVLVFPEGTRGKNPDGSLLPLEDGVAMFALRAKAPVIPFYIKGKYRLFGRLQLCAGPPVDFSGIDTSRVDKETLALCTQRIREAIHRVGDVQIQE